MDDICTNDLERDHDRPCNDQFTIVLTFNEAGINKNMIKLETFIQILSIRYAVREKLQKTKQHPY